MLSTYKSDVLYSINKEEYCFEFQFDTVNELFPYYHGNRLMKDEYIDGFVYFFQL